MSEVAVMAVIWKALWDQVRVVNNTNQTIVVSVSTTGWFESASDYTISSGSSDTWSRSKKNGQVKVCISCGGRSRSAWRDVGVIYASEILI
jgi:hypothetical protein